jgi:hypothetical protein
MLKSESESAATASAAASTSASMNKKSLKTKLAESKASSDCARDSKSRKGYISDVEGSDEDMEDFQAQPEHRPAAKTCVLLCSLFLTFRHFAAFHQYRMIPLTKLFVFFRVLISRRIYKNKGKSPRLLLFTSHYSPDPCLYRSLEKNAHVYVTPCCHIHTSSAEKEDAIVIPKKKNKRSVNNRAIWEIISGGTTSSLGSTTVVMEGNASQGKAETTTKIDVTTTTITTESTTAGVLPVIGDINYTSAEKTRSGSLEISM